VKLKNKMKTKQVITNDDEINSNDKVLATMALNDMPTEESSMKSAYLNSIQDSVSFSGRDTAILRKKLMGDVLVGCGVTLGVAPFMTTVDKAIVQKMAGTHSVLSSVSESLVSMARNPITYVRSPMFLMMWGVYAATYCTANCAKTITEHNKVEENKAKAGLVMSTTIVNSGTTMLKDRAYAMMFGTVGAAPSVPLISYGFWGLRDCMVIGSSFVLPEMVGPMLHEQALLSKDDAFRFAQLFCPIATQLLATPAQLLGLDFYNRPNKSVTERFRNVCRNYFSIFGARVSRIAPAYGIGGIGNTYFRNEWRSFVETSDEDEVSILHGAR